MVDYFSFQTGTTHPTFAAVLYTVLLAFILSTSIALTYYYTSPRKRQSKDFFQALVLSSIVAATVMQAIGESLAIGLGMLGALAIIRFRTNLENPRDIIFMFAALAAGLACGVYGFTISMVGTIAFCMVAIVLKSDFLFRRRNVSARIRFHLPYGSSNELEIAKGMKQLSKSLILEEMRVREEVGPTETQEAKERTVEYDYRILFSNQEAYSQAVRFMHEIPDIRELRINIIETR